MVVRGSLQVMDHLLGDMHFHLADNHVLVEVVCGSRMDQPLDRVISREEEVVLVEASVGEEMHMNQIRRDRTRVGSHRSDEGMGGVMICESSQLSLREIALLGIVGAKKVRHRGQHDHHDVEI